MRQPDASKSGTASKTFTGKHGQNAQMGFETHLSKKIDRRR